MLLTHSVSFLLLITQIIFTDSVPFFTTELDGYITSKVVANDSIYLVTTTSSKLYRSDDFGATWHEQNSKIPFSSSLGIQIIHPTASPSTFLLLSSTSPSVAYITSDSGATYRILNPFFPCTNLRFHPVYPDVVLGLRSSQLNNDNGISQNLLYLSRNYGMTWISLGTLVWSQFHWGHEIFTDSNEFPLNRIYFPDLSGQKSSFSFSVSGTSVADDDKQISLYHSDDFGASRTELIYGISGVIPLPGFLIVSMHSQFSESNNVRLQVTTNGYNFSSMHFPEPFVDSLPFGTFEFFVVSDGPPDFGAEYGIETSGIWLSIRKRHGLHDIYHSDFGGTHFIKVLTNVVEINNILNFGDLAANFEGSTGILIANVVDNPLDLSVYGEDRSVQSEMLIKTVISYDYGSSWKDLQMPSGLCSSGLCKLNLIFEKKGYGQFGGKGAGRVVIRNGNVGRYLSLTRTKSFISHDFGVNWREMGDPCIYDFGNLDMFFMVVTQNEGKMLYSLNEGNQWVEVTGVAGGKTVYWSNVEVRGDGNMVAFGKGVESAVIVSMSYKNLYSKNCVDTDFMEFSLSSVMELCSFGTNFSVAQKNPSTEPCWLDTAKVINNNTFYIDTCSCTDNDWECDLGFKRRGDICVLDGRPPADPPSDCKPGKDYYVSKGYRKIVSDICVSGVDHDPQAKICPTQTTVISRQSSSTGLTVLFVFAFFFVIIILVALTTRIKLVRQKCGEGLRQLGVGNREGNGYKLLRGWRFSEYVDEGSEDDTTDDETDEGNEEHSSSKSQDVGLELSDF